MNNNYEVDNLENEYIMNIENVEGDMIIEVSKPVYKSVLNRRGPVQKYDIGWKEYYRLNGYSNAYYREKEKGEIKCGICNTKTTKKSLKQHQRGKKCLKLSCALVVL
jgi:hypothetical protein